MAAGNLGMKALVSVLLVLEAFPVFSKCNVRHGYDPSRKQFIYSLRQDDLLERERIFEGRDHYLNKKERIVDNFLQYSKWKVLQETAASGDYPPSRPVDEILEEIKASDVYKLLKSMPKGGILHTHENHQLGKKRLLDTFMSSDFSRHLYVQHGINSTHEWKLEVHSSDPGKPGLFNVLENQDNPEFSIENLAFQQTMIGVMASSPPISPSDSSKRWKLANKVFGRGSPSLVVDATMKKQYLKAMYEQGLTEGIFYFETRKSFSRLERDIQLTKELVEEFKKEHPEFVGHRRIYYSKRTDSKEEVGKDLDDLRMIMKVHPDHVVGYDLVGEEDWGFTNLHHIDEFLRHMDLHDSSGNVTNHIPWLLHTAESNWIENVHIPSLNKEEDSVPRSNNLYSSILLGAKRIGHGIGFWKHPYLMELMKRKNIPVEVCVVSNQLLGYTHDLRQHPAQLFHKMGIPVILSPDDPGLFGYDEVTLDWYEAFMGWSGLNLGDLKQFAINSIKYSGMSEEEKHQVIDGVLSEKWKNYIDDVSRMACEEMSVSTLPRFEKMFPLHGSLATVSNIHFLGFNFEGALCRKIWCRFGNASNITTRGMYASNQHLICRTPTVESIQQLTSLVTPVYITWSEEHVLMENDGHSSDKHPIHARQWMETGFKFQFHEFHIESVTSGASSDLCMSFLLSLVLTCSLMLFN